MEYEKKTPNEWLLSPETWQLISYPGIFGSRRNALLEQYNREYGQNNWQIACQWGDVWVHRDFALLLYEDAYFKYLSERADLVQWITDNFKEVYDNALDNIESGFDYYIQENDATHLQDISVRRVLLRLGKVFKGTDLLEIREKESNGHILNPGVVPFHLPELIVENDRNPAWSNSGSIEAFWQCNKILLARKA